MPLQEKTHNSVFSPLLGGQGTKLITVLFTCFFKNKPNVSKRLQRIGVNLTQSPLEVSFLCHIIS